MRSGRLVTVEASGGSPSGEGSEALQLLRDLLDDARGSVAEEGGGFGALQSLLRQQSQLRVFAVTFSSSSGSLNAVNLHGVVVDVESDLHVRFAVAVIVNGVGDGGGWEIEPRTLSGMSG